MNLVERTEFFFNSSRKGALGNCVWVKSTNLVTYLRLNTVEVFTTVFLQFGQD